MKITDFHHICNSMEDNDHFDIEIDPYMLLARVLLENYQYIFDYSLDLFFVRIDSHRCVSEFLVLVLDNKNLDIHHLLFDMGL